MDRTAGAVALQLRQRKTLGNDALAGERRVAMHQHRQHRDALFRPVAMLVLLGAHLAEHHRIDDLEMRRVGGQRQMDLVVVELAVRRRAEVIFDVARAFDLVGIGRAALEFMEQSAVRFAHHLGQHVEPAAMGHAEHDLAHAEIAAALDDLLQRRDQRFAAIKAKALGAGEFQIAEFFKAFGFDQLHQNGAAAFAGEADLLIRTFDAFLDPALLRTIGDVQEFNAHGLAIGALADRHDLAQRAVFQAEHVIEEDFAVEIGLGEAVGANIEFFVILGGRQAKRIELGVEMAAHTVGADQHQRAHRIAGGLMDIGRRQLDTARLRLALQLGLHHALDFAPIAVERGEQVVTLAERPVATGPGRAGHRFFDVGRPVLQALEELLPVRIDRGRILVKAGVELVDVASVGAVEKGRKSKSGVRVLTRHGSVLI